MVLGVNEIEIEAQLYELLKSKEVKPDKGILLLFSDYLHHTWHEKQIHSYIERRWDLLNIIGSVIVSIPLGLFYRYIMRFIFWGFKYDLCYDILIIGTSITLIVILIIGLK